MQRTVNPKVAGSSPAGSACLLAEAYHKNPLNLILRFTSGDSGEAVSVLIRMYEEAYGVGSTPSSRLRNNFTKGGKGSKDMFNDRIR